MRSSLLPLALLAVSSTLAGCSGKAASGATDGGGLGSGCSVDTAIFCGGGYVGVACLSGASPEVDDAGVSCGGAAEAGADTDYCCISVTPPGLGCTEDGSLSCPTSGQVGYQCVSGTSPIGSSTFTCNYLSSSSSGSTNAYCCSG
ncbi:MAG: hypothetical protein ACRELB_08850 [Polyangiaceae bacterium]